MRFTMEVGVLFRARLMTLSGTGPAGSGTAPLYPVQHPKYGDVGTYTNTIEKAADSTTVSTQGRIKVSVLGIPVYRQSFDRVERAVDGQAPEAAGTKARVGAFHDR